MNQLCNVYVILILIKDICRHNSEARKTNFFKNVLRNDRNISLLLIGRGRNNKLNSMYIYLCRNDIFEQYTDFDMTDLL